MTAAFADSPGGLEIAGLREGLAARSLSEGQSGS